MCSHYSSNEGRREREKEKKRQMNAMENNKLGTRRHTQHTLKSKKEIKQWNSGKNWNKKRRRRERNKLWGIS